MPIIRKEEFAELANYHGANCLSIFIPTHRRGVEVNEDQDRILFKNCLQEAAKWLAERGLQPREVEQRLNAAYGLVADGFFWRQQSDGLAVFIGENFFKHYQLPVKFEQQLHLEDHFYTSPMLSVFTDDSRFFVLTLSQEQARFFEGTRHELREIDVTYLIPEELRDVVGYDYEQKALQHRSGAGRRGEGAVFHGQGAGRADDKDEIRQYFRTINEGLMEILRDEDAPLVLACVEYLYPIYEEVNDYAHLQPAYIRGNTEDVPLQTLHAKAWELVEPTVKATLDLALEQFEGFLAYQKASTELEEIIAAAVSGRVDTLFLKKGVEVYGIFDLATHTIRLDADKTLSNAPLLNLAATQTFLQQGRVYRVEPEKMPSEVAVASAIFRY